MNLNNVGNPSDNKYWDKETIIGEIPGVNVSWNCNNCGRVNELTEVF